MKKFYAILLVVIVSLCGCVTDPDTYYFDADDIIDQATKIELVICENTNPVIVSIEEDVVLLFNIDNAKIIGTLEQEKIDEFANELSTITFHKEMKSVNSPIGHTILIYMQNQEIIVLSCTIINGTAYGMAAVFSNNGDYIRHIAQFADEQKFKRLLIDYFEL